MKLIGRHRQRRRKPPRIAISQDEITADLNYPGGTTLERAYAANPWAVSTRRRTP
jgi:hypothetical protein